MSEIIYVCSSVNNKNVREGELKILRKSTYDKLCFEFGESEMNLKKRFYDNETDFEKDYNALLNLKEKAEKVSEEKEENTDELEKAENTNEQFQAEEKPKRKGLYM